MIDGNELQIFTGKNHEWLLLTFLSNEDTSLEMLENLTSNVNARDSMPYTRHKLLQVGRKVKALQTVTDRQTNGRASALTELLWSD